MGLGELQKDKTTQDRMSPKVPSTSESILVYDFTSLVLLR